MNKQGGRTELSALGYVALLSLLLLVGYSFSLSVWLGSGLVVSLLLWQGAVAQAADKAAKVTTDADPS